MAIAIGTSGGLNVGSNPGGVFNYNAAYTVLGWLNRANLTSGEQVLYLIAPSGASNDWDRVSYVSFLANRIRFVARNAGNEDQTVADSYANTVGTWMAFAVVRESATSVKTYTGESASGMTQTGSTTSGDVSSRTAAVNMTIGRWPTDAAGFDGRMTGIRAYTAALTLDEIKKELSTLRSAHSSMWGCWPLIQVDDLIDYSGNGRALVISGTQATGDGPPVSWGGVVGYAHPEGLSYAFSGTVSGYADADGAGLEVRIFRASDNAYLGSVTTTAGGAYSFTYENDTDQLYAVCIEDSTHSGASAIGTAS
jgi:hypothetical protein